jgi:hypothetical protein
MRFPELLRMIIRSFSLVAALVLPLAATPALAEGQPAAPASAPAPAAAPAAASELAPAPAPAPASAPTQAPPRPGMGPWMPPPKGQPYGPYPPYANPYPGWRLEPASDKNEGAKVWYGWQSLIGIIPSHLFIVAATLTPLDALGYIGALGHCLTSPIVHWVHGNVGRGFLSLGLNTGLPAIGLYGLLESRSEGFAIALLSIGMIGWPVIDTALLSYEETDTDKKAKKKSEFALGVQSLGVAPILDGDRKGLSLVGRF